MGLHRLRAAPYQEIGLTLKQFIHYRIQLFRLRFRHLGPKLIQSGSREGGGESSLAAIADVFERFWRSYPHRGHHSDPKKPAQNAFEAAVKRGADSAMIIEAAAAYREAVVRESTDPRFVPQAVTWLRQERWADALMMSEPPRLAGGMN